MAIIKAANSGAFSATTTWTGGIVPGINDDAVANGFVPKITTNVQVQSLRNDASGSPASTIGGGFEMNTSGVSLNATFVQIGVVVGVSTPLIRVTSISGLCTFSVTDDVTMPNANTCTFVSHTGNCDLITNGNFYSNILFNSSFVNVICILKSSPGLLTHNGNIRAGAGSVTVANCHGISNSNGAVIVNGNIQGNIAACATCFGVLMNTSSTSLTVIGNIFGGATNAGVSVTAGNINITGDITGTASIGLSTSSSGTFTMTGNAIGGSGGAGISQSAGSLSIIGNQTGAATAGISFTSTGFLTVTGVPTAGASSPAIVSTSTGIVQMTGPFINTSGVQAVRATRMFLTSTSTFWRINTAAGVQRQFSTTDYNGGYPGIPNVRDGVVFGELSEFTGTLIIPPTGSVRKDVPVDNTVGTAELTSSDFLAAIDASTSGIGLRLKNVATVATVGAQITGNTLNF